MECHGRVQDHSAESYSLQKGLLKMFVMLISTRQTLARSLKTVLHCPSLIFGFIRRISYFLILLQFLQLYFIYSSNVAYCWYFF